MSTIKGGIIASRYWQRDAGSATLSPVTDNDNVDIGTGKISAGTAKIGTYNGIVLATEGELGVGANTDNLPEGSSNLYYTQARFDADFENSSHTNLNDIGTNTHPAIDTHIADSTIHFTEASLDTTYLKLDCSNSPLTGKLDMGTHKITGLATCTDTTDATNKAYVDTVAVGSIYWQDPIISFLDFTTNEPASPSTGDRYINTVTGTSSVTSTAVKINNIYEWSGSKWDEIEASDGMTVNNQDDGHNYTYNHTDAEWKDMGTTVDHNSTSGLQGGTSNEYYHLTDDEHNNVFIKNVDDSDDITEGTTNLFYSDTRVDTRVQSNAITYTIQGTWTFNNLITCSVTPTSGSHLTNKDYVDNVASGQTWQEPVEDKDLATPPASPSTGDRYIVASGGTGDWNGHDDDIAEWNGSSWDFENPSTGWTLITLDDMKQWTWNSSAWVYSGASSHTYTASNGLTLNSNDFQLGGTLTKNTDISLSTYNLTLASTLAVFDGTNSRIGIKNSSPTTLLEVASSSNGEDVIIWGTGTDGKLHWDASKNAFHSGGVAGTQWDDANTGIYSVAMGNSPLASGINSVAFGYYSQATGDYSNVLGGYFNKATGNNSVVAGGNRNTSSNTYSAIVGGYLNTASGAYSTCVGGYNGQAQSNYSATLGGYGNSVSAEGGVAGGYSCEVGGNYGFSFGYDCTSSSSYTFTTGYKSEASASYSAVFGGSHNVASGERSVCIGGATNTASGAYSVVTGAYHTCSGSQSVILGGHNSTVSGNYSVAIAGYYHEITGTNSAILGGAYNKASGAYAVVGGREVESGGDYSFAMGYKFKLSSTADRTFAFGYSSTDLSITQANAIILYNSYGTKVGIGTVAPIVGLEIGGAGSILGNLYFSGTAGGDNEGIAYKDTGGGRRFGLLFPGSDVVKLTNRASNGVLQFCANTATAGVSGETLVAQVEDTAFNLYKNIISSASGEFTVSSGNLDYKIESSDDTSQAVYWSTNDSGAIFQFGMVGSNFIGRETWWKNSGGIYANSTATATIIDQQGTKPIRFYTNSLKRAEIEGAGDVHFYNDVEVDGGLTAESLAGDWDDSSSNYVRLGNMQICWGITGTITGGSNVTVTFPQAFKSGTVPQVVATSDTRDGYNVSVGSSGTSSVTNTGCKIYAQSGNTNVAHWVAIGIWQ